MGDFDGSLRHVGWGFQQLRSVAGRQPGDSGRCIRSGVPSAAGAAVVCDHTFAGKDPAGAGNGAEDFESGLVGSGHWVGSYW